MLNNALSENLEPHHFHVSKDKIFYYSLLDEGKELP